MCVAGFTPSVRVRGSSGASASKYMSRMDGHTHTRPQNDHHHPHTNTLSTHAPSRRPACGPSRPSAAPSWRPRAPCGLVCSWWIDRSDHWLVRHGIVVGQQQCNARARPKPTPHSTPSNATLRHALLGERLLALGHHLALRALLLAQAAVLLVVLLDLLPRVLDAPLQPLLLRLHRLERLRLWLVVWWGVCRAVGCRSSHVSSGQVRTGRTRSTKQSD